MSTLLRSYVLVLFGLCAATCGALDHLRADERPNVVLLLADDLGYADVGCYGHPYAKTPAIDQLASSGTIFRHYYNAAPICAPSRCGLTTGRFPGVFSGNTSQIGLGDTLTVTQILQEKGYRIGHFGKWDLGSIQEHGVYEMDDVQEIRGDPQADRGRDAVVADAAINFIQRHQDGPFYVNVWFHAPHHPVRPARQFTDRYPEGLFHAGDFPNAEFAAYSEAYQNALGSFDEAMRNYLGDVSQLDDQVARILESLDDCGLREKTIVVVSSDNGPARRGGEQPFRTETQEHENLTGSAGSYRRGKHSLYEGGVRAPWIVRWPGHVPEGRVDESSVIAAVDWLPTLAAIVGSQRDLTQFDGEDMSDVWRGQSRKRGHDVFWAKGGAFGPVLAVRRGDWKLCWLKSGELELYDLARDPIERNNLAESNPQVVRELRQAMERWIESLPAESTARAMFDRLEAKRETKGSSERPWMSRWWMFCVVIGLGGLWLIWRRMSSLFSRVETFSDDDST